MEAGMTVCQSASTAASLRASVSGHFAQSFEGSSTWGPREKFERTDYWKHELRRSTKHLHGALPQTAAGRIRRGKCWSPERRARQAQLIRRWAPWRRSTGPKTEAGKARCAQNALRHGFRSRARTNELQRIRYALRLAAENIKALRLLIQLRRNAARPRLKYKPQCLGASVRRPWRRAGSRAILPAKYAKYGGETCGH